MNVLYIITFVIAFIASCAYMPQSIYKFSCIKKNRRDIAWGINYLLTGICGIAYTIAYSLSLSNSAYMYGTILFNLFIIFICTVLTVSDKFNKHKIVNSKINLYLATLLSVVILTFLFLLILMGK